MYCQAVRPHFLPVDCSLWADAHHRAASIIIKTPQIIDSSSAQMDLVDSRGKPISTSDIHIEAAISHLTLALRCPALTNSRAMDIYFHRAQVWQL